MTDYNVPIAIATIADPDAREQAIERWRATPTPKVAGAPLFCLGCAMTIAGPTVVGENMECTCGWHYMLEEDGSIQGRDPASGPHGVDMTSEVDGEP